MSTVARIEYAFRRRSQAGKFGRVEYVTMGCRTRAEFDVKYESLKDLPNGADWELVSRVLSDWEPIVRPGNLVAVDKSIEDAEKRELINGLVNLGGSPV